MVRYKNYIEKIMSNLKLQRKSMSTYSMNTQTLKNLTKDQLIELILKQNKKINILSQKRQINDVIQPPLEFRDNYKPVPAPRKSRWCRIMKTT